VVLIYRHRVVADISAISDHFLKNKHQDLQACLLASDPTLIDPSLETEQTVICRRSRTGMVVQWWDFQRGYYTEVRGPGFRDVLATLAQLSPEVALGAGKDRVGSGLRGCRDPDTTGAGLQITWRCTGPGGDTDVTFTMADSSDIAQEHARSLLPAGRPLVKNTCDPPNPVGPNLVGHTEWTADSPDDPSGPFWCFLDGQSPVYVWVDDYNAVAYLARLREPTDGWVALEKSWEKLTLD
jgi:hypothetical protein